MMTKTRTTPFVVAAFALSGIVATLWADSAAAGQRKRAAAPKETSVWDGAYTEEQSKQTQDL